MGGPCSGVAERADGILIDMRRVWSLAAAALAGLAGGACGSTQAPTTVDVVGGSAAATARSSTSKVSVTYSLRGGLSAHSAPSVQTGEYDFVHHIGEFTNSVADSSSSGAAVSSVSQTIVTPSQTYSSLPLGPLSLGALPGKRWLANPSPSGKSADPTILSLINTSMPADPNSVLASLSTLHSSVRSMGRTTVDGTAVTEYSLVLRPVRSAGCTISQFGDAHPLHLWLDSQQRARQIQAQFLFPTPSNGPTRVPAATLTVTINYSDFGLPVTVTIPPVSQVESYVEFQKQLQSNVTRPGGGAHNTMTASC